MTVYARPGDTFEAKSRFPTGLAASIGVRILDKNGSEVLPRQSNPGAGIIELEAPSGLYSVTLLAPVQGGQYTLFWDRGSISLSTTNEEDLIVGPAVPTGVVEAAVDQNYVPSIDLVGRKTMSRTRDQYNNLLGTFTSTTEPTDTQVQNIVFDVLTEVADVIGDTVPEALRDDAANVVAERAAMQIELNFFADQVNTGRSIYPQLKDLYEADLARLTKALIEYEGTGVIGDTGASKRPSWSFPAPSTTMTERW